ncbi:MAG: PIN domain-containing protein [Methylococcales bacterium]|nr:PIN domain-containing protein [Methylococcales bacterium]
MIAVDTNVILRFLLKPIDSNNPKWQVEQAEDIINQADKVFISDIVLVEMEWILEGVFACSRKEICTLLRTLVNNTQFCFTDWATINCALLDYSEHSKVELSDFLIARQAKSIGATTLYTFESEKKLGGVSGVTCLKP